MDVRGARVDAQLRGNVLYRSVLAKTGHQSIYELSLVICEIGFDERQYLFGLEPGQKCFDVVVSFVEPFVSRLYGELCQFGVLEHVEVLLIARQGNTMPLPDFDFFQEIQNEMLRGLVQQTPAVIASHAYILQYRLDKVLVKI